MRDVILAILWMATLAFWLIGFGGWTALAYPNANKIHWQAVLVGLIPAAVPALTAIWIIYTVG